jgi:hypothetical protein
MWDNNDGCVGCRTIFGGFENLINVCLASQMTVTWILRSNLFKQRVLLVRELTLVAKNVCQRRHVEPSEPRSTRAHPYVSLTKSWTQPREAQKQGSPNQPERGADETSSAPQDWTRHSLQFHFRRPLPSKFSGTYIIILRAASRRGARTHAIPSFTAAAATMKPPATLGAAVLLLWWSASVTVAGAERVRGGGAAAVTSSTSSSSDATAHRRRQIRRLKNRGEPVRYARLLLDEGEPADEGNDEQGRRRLPPSKVSKACSSKSLKGSKEGGKAGSGTGKAGTGKASKSGTDPRPSCDTERSFCSCPSCTQEVLDRMAGEYTCGARMEYLLAHNSGAFSKTRQACGRVAGLEFPEGAYHFFPFIATLPFSTPFLGVAHTQSLDGFVCLILECGECDPSTCTGRAREEPKFYWYVSLYDSVILLDDISSDAP